MGNTATTITDPVQLKDISGIQLQGVSSADGALGESVESSTLWASQPAVVYVVRRPGCALCREHALDLSAKAAEFKSIGVRLVGVVHETLGADEFARDFFPNGELFFDEKKAFFESLGSRWLGLHGLLLPSVHANAKRAKSKNVEGNFKGEGRLLGGLLIVGKGDAGVLFEHREKVFGDHAEVGRIVAAAYRSVGKEPPPGTQLATSENSYESNKRSSPRKSNSKSPAKTCSSDVCAAPPKAA